MITIAVAVSGFLLALLLAWPILRRRLIRRRMERCIARSGLEQLRNVMLDDGMGGLTFFEWLLLTPHDIRVLNINNRGGIIFAGERMDIWAQVVGKRTIRFPNPLYGMESLLSTLRYHLPKVSTDGRILFTGNCSFPKGRPENVLTLDDLASDQEASSDKGAQPVMEQAWQELKEKARKIDPTTEGYLLPVKESPTLWRWLAIVALLSATAGWLYWRW